MVQSLCVSRCLYTRSDKNQQKKKKLLSAKMILVLLFTTIQSPQKVLYVLYELCKYCNNTVQKWQYSDEPIITEPLFVYVFVSFLLSKAVVVSSILTVSVSS